ncbi:hypothetical protein ACQ4PT_049163 [Festuca glaucescens]
MDAAELWALPGYYRLLRVPVDYPVVSMDEPGVLCILLCEDHHDRRRDDGDGTVWMIEVDMVRKLLRSVARYDKRFRHEAFLPNEVSKHFGSHPRAHSKQRQKKNTHKLFTNAGTTRGFRGQSRQFPRAAVERRRSSRAAAARRRRRASPHPAPPHSQAPNHPAPPASAAPPRAAAQPSLDLSRAAAPPEPPSADPPRAAAAAERRRPCQALSPRAVALTWPCVLRRAHRAEQNAVKHLSPVKGEDEVEGEDDEPHILSDFSACMFGFEDKTTFQEAFDDMRCKVHKQTCPMQGHINPVRRLAARVAAADARVTISTAVSGHRLMFPSLASPDDEAVDAAGLLHVPFSDG